MVISSMTPATFPVYAAEVLTEEPGDTLISTDDTLYSEEVTKDSSSGEISEDDFVVINNDTVSGDTLSENDVCQVVLHADGIASITYDEYDLSGNLVRKDKEAPKQAGSIYDFILDTVKDGEVRITKVTYDPSGDAICNYEGSCYAFPGAITYGKKTAAPDYSGDYTTWSIPDIGTDMSATLTNRNINLDNNVDITVAKGDPAVEIVAYSGVKNLLDSETFLENQGYNESTKVANDYKSNKAGSFFVQLSPFEYDKDYTYKVKSVTYKDAAGTVKNAKVTYTLGFYQVEIARADVIDLLVKSGKKLELSVTQEKASKTFSFTLAGSYGTQTANASYDKTTISAGSTMQVKKGGKVNIKAKARNGYNVTGISVNTISITGSGSFNKIEDNWQIIDDAATVKKLTGDSGYDYTVNNKTKVVVNTSSYKWTKVCDAYDNPLTKNNGKYQVNPDKYVFVYCYDGDTPVGPSKTNDFNNFDWTGYLYNLYLDGADITKDAVQNGILNPVSSETSNYLYLNTNNTLVLGKELTLKLNSVYLDPYDDNAKKKETIDTFVFSVEDTGKRGAKISKTFDTMPIGTMERTYGVEITGNYTPAITIDGASFDPATSPIRAKFSKDYTSLTVTASRDASEGIHTLEIINSASSEAYAALSLKLEKDTVAAASPTLKVTDTTNNRIALALTTGNLDKTLDGLTYEIKAVTAGNPKVLKKTVSVSNLPASTANVDLWLTDDHNSTASEPNDYKITCSLVQKTSSGTTIASSKTASADAKTTDCIYAKSLTLKGSGKTYTNVTRDRAYTLSVTYNEGTTIRRLEKIELKNSSGTIETVSSSSIGKHISFSDSAISFYPYDSSDKLAPGTYTIVAYAYGSKATGSANVTVTQAIESLSIKGVIPTLIQQPGKDTTMLLTAFDTTNSSNPVKTSQVTWSIVGGSGSELKDISVKNGKVTIAKSFKATGSTTFYVKVTANDYKGNPTSYVTDEITVTSSYSNKYVFNYTDKLGNWKTLSDSSISASDIFNSNYNGYSNVATISLFEAGSADRCISATYKVSGATLLNTVEYTDGSTFHKDALIRFKKPGTVKITATANDGSGRKLTKSFKVNYLKDGKIAFMLINDDFNPSTMEFEQSSGSLSGILATNFDMSTGTLIKGDFFTATNPGTESMPFYLYATGFKDHSPGLINQKVKVKGGKLVKFKNMDELYAIFPNDETTNIVITNADTKQEITLKVTNQAIVSKKGSTKILASNKANGKEAKGKIYCNIDFSAAGNYSAVAPNRVTYTVKNADEATYVLVNVLNDDSGSGNPISSAVGRVGTSFLGNKCYAIPLSGTGRDKTFTIDYADASGRFSIKNGTYTLSVTPVNVVNGAYIATDKAASLKVAAVKTPVAKVTPKSKVVFKSSNGKIDKGNKAVIEAGKYNNYSRAYGVKFLETQNVVINGKANRFASFFAVDSKGTLSLIGSGLDTKNKAYKSELTGIVKYEYQQLDGKIVPATLKVTISTAK
jgi:hypothetical protein